MEDLVLRKKLIWQEIARLKSEMAKNREFMLMFQKDNDDHLVSMEKKYKELDVINDQMLADERQKQPEIIQPTA